MGKRLIVSIIAACLVLFGYAVPVKAHVEASNNGVRAVMHIVPDDNPTAGKPILINLSMSARDPAFSVISCKCQLHISQAGRKVATYFVEPADQSDSNGLVSVTFPEQGVYDLRLTGGIGSGSFTIPYAVRVNPAGGAANSAAGINVVMIGLASLAIVGILAYNNISKGGRYDTPPSKGNHIST